MILLRFLNSFKPLRSASKIIDIYTDGSHKGKWGSWAYVIVRNNKIIHEASGRVKKTDSHRMEFQAAIEALNYLKPGTRACLYSDSRILINAATKPMKITTSNSDQIILLNELIEKNKISWKWVKAHSGIKFNERCDELCILARDGDHD